MTGVRDIKAAAESLKEASQRFSRSAVALEALLQKAQAGEGTLGKLINEGELYDHLDELVRDLDELVKDWKENPKKYLHFGLF